MCLFLGIGMSLDLSDWSGLGLSQEKYSGGAGLILVPILERIALVRRALDMDMAHSFFRQLLRTSHIYLGASR